MRPQADNERHDTSNGFPELNSRINEKKILISLLIMLAALAVRLVMLSRYADNPLYLHLLADDAWYVEKAHEILNSGLAADRAFSRSPLFPLILAAIFRVSKYSVFAVRIFSLVTDALTPMLIFMIGKEIHSALLGFVAGMFYAFFFPAIFFSFQILPAASATFFLCLAGCLFIRGIKRNRLLPLCISGFCLGLAALLKPSIMGLFPVWLAASLFLSAGYWGRRTMTVLLFFMGFAIALLPVTIHNYRAEGAVVLISSQGGINFFIGNNPESNGTSPVAFTDAAYGETIMDDLLVLHSARLLAENDHGQRLTSAVISRHWYRQAFSFIKEHPVDFFKLYLYKIYLFLQARELPNNFEPRFFFGFWQFPWVLLLDFRILTPLFLAGLLCVSRRGDWLFITVNSLVYVGLTALFFVCSRYRVPGSPFMILTASWGLIHWLKHGRKGRLAILLPCLVVFLAILVTVDFFHLDRDLSQLMRIRVAVSYILEHKLDEGEEHLVKILEKNREQEYELLKIDTALKSSLALGKLNRVRGDLKEAVRHFETTVSLAPDTLFSTEPLFHLGVVNLQLKNYQESERAFRKVLRLRPGHMPVLFALMELYREQGDMRSLHQLQRRLCRLIQSRILLNSFVYTPLYWEK